MRISDWSSDVCSSDLSPADAAARRSARVQRYPRHPRAARRQARRRNDRRDAPQTRRPRRWRAFIRNAKRLHEGDAIDFGNTVSAIASDRTEDGSFALTFAGDEPDALLLDRAGRMPLTPYLAGKRATDARDADSYQPMFAREAGAGHREALG